MPQMPHRSPARIAPLVLSLGALVVPMACSSNSPSSASSGNGHRLQVVASFYPLQFVVQRIGGDRVHVENLTPMGAEPHELELTAKNTASLEDADLVVYLSGFAPAVDEGVADVAKAHAFDVASAARLDLDYSPIEDGQQDTNDNRRDPHFWLDPTRLIDVATAVSTRLAQLDPADTALFDANATTLIAELHTLDGEYTNGLAHCTNTDIVTSHNAFGYLSQHYGLTQVGITGLTPEDEPTPGELARVTKFVEDHHVGTIYYETLVSPTIAETVAHETGAKTQVLDPIEGLSSSSQGTDYFQIMRANLANLRAGQGCS
ncbi:MAG: ABC-transporter metal-binding lipoprotein [Ilumatobacteraceae bacterium]|nr:ABC-transporter metal-binding lipoprotein [Ilumatobacteraceae bacterium]